MKSRLQMKMEAPSKLYNPQIADQLAAAVVVIVIVEAFHSFSPSVLS